MPPRRTFCSAAERDCLHQHKMRTDPSYQAKLVLERDKGVCAECGRDCVALARELEALVLQRSREMVRDGEFGRYDCYRAGQWKFGDPAPSNCGHDDCVEIKAQNVAWCFPERLIGNKLQELGIPKGFVIWGRTFMRRLWEMDHIVPVVEGGGSCGIENLRTLCFACHRRETRELARRRAERRKQENELAGKT